MISNYMPIDVETYLPTIPNALLLSKLQPPPQPIGGQVETDLGESSRNDQTLGKVRIAPNEAQGAKSKVYCLSAAYR